MNVTEMHLAIQQGVDKINSLQADMLLSEEIDIELNKSQIRFINTKYGKNNKYGQGFEESQKRIDDLRTLVREFSNAVTFKEQLSDDYWIDSFTLPSDYMYLVNQTSKVWINDCNPINWILDYPDPINYFTLDLNTFVCDGGNGFVDSIVMYENAGDALLGNVTGTAVMWAGGSFSYPADIQAVQAHILANPGIGFDIYWEQFGDLVHPGEFIVVVDTNIHTWFNWDASLGDVSSMVGLNSTGEHEVNAIPLFNDSAFDSRRVPQWPWSDRLTVVNKFIQQDDIFTLLDDPFNTTKYTSPLTTIRGGVIDIYTSAIFIIDTIKITYIRNPQRISLPLGISCELPEHTHQEIVDMTVSSILEGISDPRYKSHQLEVSKNE